MNSLNIQQRIVHSVILYESVISVAWK